MPIDDPAITVRPLASDAEARAAAEIMAGTDPWITLRATADRLYTRVTDPQFEVYVAVTAEDAVVGVVTVCMKLPVLKGYVGVLAVAANYRNRGLGARLLAFAESRILRESPNVFLCVTTFNTAAQRFYARHGYTPVGTLTAYTLPDHGEILLRKTTGPWSTFTPTATTAP